MSTDAPWIALAIDFIDSAMFRGDGSLEQRATHGETLAWVCLLCWAKAFGRAGRVRLVKSAFANRFHLSQRAVDGMLSRAQKCAAVEIDGEYVSVVNWGTYQSKASSAKYRKSPSFPETSSTKHQAPSTKHLISAQTADADSCSTEIAWSRASGWQHITNEDRQRWRMAYPACDIDRQLARMHEWLTANPTKSRKKQWRRFITNWLTRSQERGGDGVVDDRPPKKESLDELLDHIAKGEQE